MDSKYIYEWKKSDRYNLSEKATEVVNNFNTIMNEEFASINELVENNEPYSAYNRMIELVSFINSHGAHETSILDKLQDWLDSIRSALEGIAEKVDAESFSIGAGMPFGVSVSLSFKVKET